MPTPPTGVAIHWNIIVDNSTIHADDEGKNHDEIEVAVAVRATGWVSKYERQHQQLLTQQIHELDRHF